MAALTLVPAGPARHARVRLAPGLTLMEAIAAAMAEIGWRSATLLLLGGRMARAFYHNPVPVSARPRWIDYGPAREVPAPAWLVMGSATFGQAADGSPAMHCHATLAGSAGLVGGHLPPERCVLGPDGLVAHATSGTDAHFRLRRDPATTYDLLTPA